MRRIVLIAGACLIAATAVAETQQGRAESREQLTNCPPSSAGRTTGAASEAQAVEKSAIVPDAGGEEQSAAPTVQRKGEAVEVRPDCPLDPKQPMPKN